MRNKKFRERGAWCGDFADIDMYSVYLAGKKGRRGVYRETSAVQARLNDRYSKRRFKELCHANFSEGGRAVHPTYRLGCEPMNDEQCRRDFRNFVRRLERRFRKKGLEFRYMGTSQRGERSGRYHHHLIIPEGLTENEIQDCWGLGLCDSDALRFTETGVADLTAYIGRGKDKSIKGDGDEIMSNIWRMRWCASKNLIEPKITENNALTKREMVELADCIYEDGRISAQGQELVGKRYPGWACAEAFVEHNEINGGLYVRLRLFRYGAKKFDWLRRGRPAKTVLAEGGLR